MTQIPGSNYLKTQPIGAAQDLNRRNWLPLKVDDKAKLKLEGITATTWNELKTKFLEASIDPHEQFNWHARRCTIR